MNFTGERFIPNQTDKQLEIEHVQRYLSIQPLVKNKVVLDAACGEGYGAYTLSKYAKKVYGIDLSQEAIVHAQLSYRASNIEFIEASIDNMSIIPDDSIDIVVSFETIEHVDEQLQNLFLNEIKRVLKTDGILVMSTPDKHWYTDVPNHRNPFHVREFYKHEFYSFLKGYFRYVQFYYQKNEVFSVIGSGSSDSSYRLLDDAESILNQGKYIIAVCSMNEREDIDISTLRSNIDTQYHMLIDRIINLQDEVQERNDHLKKLDLEIAHSHENLRLNKSEISHKDEIINELRSAEDHRIELESTVKRLESELISKDQVFEDQTKEKQLQVDNLHGHVQLLLEQERKLNNIYHSGGWRVLRRYYKTRDALFPINSKRKLFFKLLKIAMTDPKRLIRNTNKDNIKKFIRYLKTERTGLLENRVENFLERQSVTTSIRLEIIQNIDTTQKLAFPFTEKPVVSIVIPVYNQWNYTYSCLASIIQNTDGIDYEIIIADDMSQDETEKIKEIVENVIVVRDGTNRGFLLNCNNAAQHARGKYVLFLNNDTNVQPDWLSSLLDLIERDEKIGMVGSKLIYPDGRQQEAGGIIWSDASGWNYGRLDDPELPQYNYVKEADYMSGAAIMIRKDLWERIGGFDERYAPAYFEDSDLAFEVRKLGYKVMFQPKSVVVHFEGISHGTDTRSGIKSYQVRNKEKFITKWSAELKASQYDNGQHVFHARDRSRFKKTMLIVDHYVPHVDKDAGSRTVFQYISLFIEMGYNVKFIGDNFYRHEPYTGMLQQLGVEVIYGNWYAKNIDLWFEENGAQIDIAYLNRPHVAFKYIDKIKKYTKSRIIYYGHDLHFLRELREYRITNNAALLKSSNEWKKIESELLRKADVAYYPSQVEVDEIHRNFPEVNARAIPAYIYPSSRTENPDKLNFSQKHHLLFVGGFGHTPNIDAVLWFVEEVLPKIKMNNPDLKLYVVGSNPPDEILQLQSNSVIVTGFVTDEKLAQLYNECRLVVVPLRYGAGVKGKVVEAMYHGCPIVTTSIGSEGLKNIQDCVLEVDNAEEFANTVGSIYSDIPRLEILSGKSYEYVQKYFSKSSVIKAIQQDIDIKDAEAVS